jgi:hypothetical protein
VLDDQANLAAEDVALQLADAVQVELIDQLVVYPPLEQVEFFRLRGVSGPATGGERLNHRRV